MNNQIVVLKPYLLIDGALLPNEFEENWHTASTDVAWLTPLLTGEGALNGPIMIDIEKALAHELVDEMMDLVNAISPQLHLSFIESVLAADELVRYLQNFVVIRTSDGQLFNLRLSDCIVLSMLEDVLTAAQWASLLGGVARWCVHDREGRLRELKTHSSLSEPIGTPLTLSPVQLDQLTELTEPDVILANIRDIRHGGELMGSVSEQHNWALQARDLWRGSKCTDRLALRWLTSAAIDTRGAIFERPGLAALLEKADREELRAAFTV